MTTKPSYSFVLFAALAIVISLSATAFGQTASNADFSNIKIKNFGQMDERFYRGAQPDKADYQQLSDLGIKTVIDLTDDPKPYEKSSVEALGMRYVNIPMSDKRYPQSASIEQFLKLVDDPATGKFYVHCAGGRHRTGVMGAVYRFNHYNWNYDQVYSEMKNYDFYTRWGHGDLKKFVQEYATSYQHNATTTAAAAATTGTKQK
jgi:protein tyrosine/serine phosphatase